MEEQHEPITETELEELGGEPDTLDCRTTRLIAEVERLKAALQRKLDAEDVWGQPRVLREDMNALRAEVERLSGHLERFGYRRCDIPACNCDGFHGGHAEARLREIYEALGGCDGTTPVPAIKALRGRLSDAEEVLEVGKRLWERDYEVKYLAEAINNTLAAIREEKP